MLSFNDQLKIGHININETNYKDFLGDCDLADEARKIKVCQEFMTLIEGLMKSGGLRTLIGDEYDGCSGRVNSVIRKDVSRRQNYFEILNSQGKVILVIVYRSSVDGKAYVMGEINPETGKRHVVTSGTWKEIKEYLRGI